ncbi:MAG: hypothetical protein K2M04_08530 [Muribaculaceae bacterium]|nr:hypothetical protein [Muribaculaceae bacterium]
MKKNVILYLALMLTAVGMLSFSTYTPVNDVDAEVQAMVERHAKDKHLNSFELVDDVVTAKAR